VCVCDVLNAPLVFEQEPLKQVVVEEEPPEEWQREVEEEEPAPPEDWQREVEEGDIEEEVEEEIKVVSKRKMMVSMALPFLTGVSPAGFLSANRKQPGGPDHLVQVRAHEYS